MGNTVTSETENFKKYILIQGSNSIAYDNEKCFINEEEYRKDVNDKIKADKIAEDLKKEKFYNTFLKKHYKNIVVLTGAGSSMDNGTNSGKSMAGLWKECKEPIDELVKIIPNLKNKSFYDDENPDIEAFISHITLLEKIDETNAAKIKEQREKIEEIIRKECSLTLQEKTPYIDFLNKITARKNNDPRVQIFTTNYDTLFEQAGNKAGFVIIDGFSFTQPREFSGKWFDLDIVNREKTRLKQEESFIQKVFHLYKLHGSLTWERNGDKIEQKDNPTNPLMIYPSSEKYESSYEQPYFEMMSRFQQALRKEETLLIVIGFSLADKHLKNVILEAVEQNPSFQLVIVSYNQEGSIIVNDYIRDLFTEPDDLKVKRNVNIVFDSFKNFTDNFPENKTYSQNNTNETLQS